MYIRIIPLIVFFLFNSNIFALSNSSERDVTIISVPSGLRVHVISESKLTGENVDVVQLTSQETYVGVTPLTISLDPGEYSVAITGEEVPGDFRNDGESQVIEVLRDGGFVRNGKVYTLEKRANQRAFVTALFWSKQETLINFMERMPKDKKFKIRGIEKMITDFKEYNIPENHHELLLQMLERTGKAIWLEEERDRRFLVYFTEYSEEGVPTRLLIDPAEKK
jgi:hypothetical protein